MILAQACRKPPISSDIPEPTWLREHWFISCQHGIIFASLHWSIFTQRCERCRQICPHGNPFRTLKTNGYALALHLFCRSPHRPMPTQRRRRSSTKGRTNTYRQHTKMSACAPHGNLTEQAANVSNIQAWANATLRYNCQYLPKHQPLVLAMAPESAWQARILRDSASLPIPQDLPTREARRVLQNPSIV